MGRGAAGIVSAEAVALMEGIVNSVTNTKLMLATASILICRPGHGRRGRPGLFRHRQNDPLRAFTPEKNPNRRAAAAPPVPRTRPVRRHATPAKDQGPLVIQAEVVDSNGFVCRVSMSSSRSVCAQLRRTAVGPRAARTAAIIRGRGRCEWASRRASVRHLGLPAGAGYGDVARNPRQDLAVHWKPDPQRAGETNNHGPRPG